MNEREVVSIILPTYNRAHSVERAIESVLAQTFKNWELIICDDGSIDNTAEAVEPYLAKDRRVQYHWNTYNQGLPRNRNIGLSLAKGELVYFIEDDVVLDPQCLEILVATFKELKAKGIYIGGVGPRSVEPKKQGRLLLLERYMGNQKRRGMVAPASMGKWTGLAYQNFGVGNGVVESPLLPSWSLFSKSALDKVGGYEGKAYNRFNYSHEETDMFTRLADCGYRLYFQPAAVAQHKHEDRGGTRTSPIKYYYYYLGAHIVFLARNFGWKAVYMIPACLSFIAFGILRGLPALIRGYEE